MLTVCVRTWRWNREFRHGLNRGSNSSTGASRRRQRFSRREDFAGFGRRLKLIGHQVAIIPMSVTNARSASEQLEQATP